MIFQDSVCRPDQLTCLGNITKDYSKCTKSCEGILVTSFEKHNMDQSIESIIPELTREYSKYKTDILFPAEIKG